MSVVGIMLDESSLDRGLDELHLLGFSPAATFFTGCLDGSPATTGLPWGVASVVAFFGVEDFPCHELGLPASDALINFDVWWVIL
jgi:hypothetical protein